jgi:hypothetical protein
MKKILLIGAALLVIVFVARAKPANQELDDMTTKHNGTGKKATTLDWSKIKNFSPAEFGASLDLLDSGVVLALQKLRDKIGAIMISPAAGAIVRTDNENTMHYADDGGKGRLSVAIDIMPLDTDLKTAYRAAKQINEIGAVGVYPHWLPFPGLHIDLRKRKPGHLLAEWSGLKINGEQIYKGVNEAFV